MRDRYFEQFFVDKMVAEREVEILSEDYGTVTMYDCAGGFMVSADRESDRGL